MSSSLSREGLVLRVSGGGWSVRVVSRHEGVSPVLSVHQPVRPGRVWPLGRPPPDLSDLTQADREPPGLGV